MPPAESEFVRSHPPNVQDLSVGGVVEVVRGRLKLRRPSGSLEDWPTSGGPPGRLAVLLRGTDMNRNGPAEAPELRHAHLLTRGQRMSHKPHPTSRAFRKCQFSKFYKVAESRGQLPVRCKNRMPPSSRSNPVVAIKGARYYNPTMRAMRGGRGEWGGGGFWGGGGGGGLGGGGGGGGGGGFFWGGGGGGGDWGGGGGG